MRTGAVIGVTGAAAVVGVVVWLAVGPTGGPADLPASPPPAPEVAVAPDVADPGDDVGATAPREAAEKRVVDEVHVEWGAEDRGHHRDDAVPLTDEQWADNPCNDMAEMIIGTRVVDAQTVEAQIAAARSHNPRNHMIDGITWTYAGCLSIKKGDPTPCADTPGVVLRERCEGNLLTYLLLRPTSADACFASISSLGEVKRDRFLYKQVCRAATGDSSVCANFRQPTFRWYCEQLAEPDPSRCEGIEDPESQAECPHFAALLRTARGQPPGDVALEPRSELGMLRRLLTEPDFDCAAWYREALRAECR